MSYVTRDYLVTQFTNFATRILTVFAKKADLPVKTSDLTNDSGYITVDVDNLSNYYKKEDTCSKEEIVELCGNITALKMEVVLELPVSDISESTIYLVPKSTAETNNVYAEYVNINGTWEIIGDTSMDLSQYLTTSAAASTYVSLSDTESNNIDFSTYFS